MAHAAIVHLLAALEELIQVLRLIWPGASVASRWVVVGGACHYSPSSLYWKASLHHLHYVGYTLDDKM